MLAAEIGLIRSHSSLVSWDHANTKERVDLVRRLPDGGFEFVELKIASDTPLYATIEVLTYGLLWLLSRRSRAQLGYASNPILDTPTLQLSTLAPMQFYVGLMPFGFSGVLIVANFSRDL